MSNPQAPHFAEKNQCLPLGGHLGLSHSRHCLHTQGSLSSGTAPPTLTSSRRILQLLPSWEGLKVGLAVWGWEGGLVLKIGRGSGTAHGVAKSHGGGLRRTCRPRAIGAGPGGEPQPWQPLSSRQKWTELPPGGDGPRVPLEPGTAGSGTVGRRREPSGGCRGHSLPACELAAARTPPRPGAPAPAPARRGAHARSAPPAAPSRRRGAPPPPPRPLPNRQQTERDLKITILTVQM